VGLAPPFLFAELLGVEVRDLTTIGSAIVIATLYIFGLWWCYEVVARFPRDVREMFELKELARTFATIVIWLLTIPIMLAVILYGCVIITRLIWFLRTL